MYVIDQRLLLLCPRLLGNCLVGRHDLVQEDTVMVTGKCECSAIVNTVTFLSTDKLVTSIGSDSFVNLFRCGFKVFRCQPHVPSSDMPYDLSESPKEI